MSKNENMKTEQLCFRCRRSFLSGCPWADHFEPVPGWAARIMQCGRTTEGPIQTYSIEKCPLFKDDAPKGASNRTYYAKRIEIDTGAQILAAEILKQACVDYMVAYKQDKSKKKEEWFKRQYDIYRERMERTTGKKWCSFYGRRGMTYSEFADEKQNELDKTMNECKRFFRPNLFKSITDMDPDKLLKRLQLKARTFRSKEKDEDNECDSEE